VRVSNPCVRPHLWRMSNHPTELSRTRMIPPVSLLYGLQAPVGWMAGVFSDSPPVQGLKMVHLNPVGSNNQSCMRQSMA
jgi:hypothetical protein